MNKLKSILFLLLSVMCLPLSAQTDIITYDRAEYADQLWSDDAKHGFLIVSSYKDLVISVTNASRPVDVNMLGADSQGLFMYRVLLNADDTKQPNVEVGRRGSVYKKSWVLNVRADMLTAYRVEETPFPIRIDARTAPNDALLEKDSAAVEIISSIPNLQVKYSSKLRASLSRATDKADASITIISIHMPVVVLQEAKAKLEQLNAEHGRLVKKMETTPNAMTEADFERMDDLEAAIAEAERYLQEITYLDIYSDNTNHLSIGFGELQARSKKRYAVLPIVVEREKFVTESAGFMSQAANLFRSRKYEDARVAYNNAFEAKDVEENMKPAIVSCINQCDSCITYSKYAAAAIREIKRMRDDNTATQDRVAKYASAAVEFLKVVNAYNPDDFYEERIAKLEAIVEDMPLKISFTVVEWLTVKEGSGLPDVEVWAYSGTRPISPVDMASVKKLRNFMSRNAASFRHVGTTDASGKLTMELNRKALPAGFVFVPTSDKAIKNSFLTFADLMRQAQGTYFEKQFRFKMYKRTSKYF